MKIEIEVANKIISNLLACAFEGGSSYWLKSTSASIYGDPALRPNRILVPFVDGGEVLCVCKDEPYKGKGCEYKLNREVLKRGLGAMFEKSPKQFGLAIAGKGDSDVADNFLQFCLFGELVYG